MKNTVLSIEQMQELIELGINTNKASCEWSHRPYYGWKFHQKGAGTDSNKEYILTFTLQDILEMIPKPCYLNCIDNDFYQCEITTKNGSTTTNGISPLNAAFNMLKWCKQNNYCCDDLT